MSNLNMEITGFVAGDDLEIRCAGKGGSRSAREGEYVLELLDVSGASHASMQCLASLPALDCLQSRLLPSHLSQGKQRTSRTPRGSAHVASGIPGNSARRNRRNALVIFLTSASGIIRVSSCLGIFTFISVIQRQASAAARSARL